MSRPQRFTNRPNGDGAVLRDGDGRFIAGTAGGPGNPHARRVAEWRAAMAKAVTGDDIECVVRKLAEAAKDGKPWAIRELLDRTVGSLAHLEMAERAAIMEQVLGIER